MPRQQFLAPLCFVALALALTGCPLAGSMVEGTWRTYLDESCDASTDGFYGFVLHANGTAEWYIGNLYLGTWDLNGSTITVQFTTPQTAMFTGGLSVNSTEITDGTFSISGAGSGCFTAEKIDL
ncbi:MAG: hypothetical protein KJ060_13085 [Candidatus Hydrogenedentes bacterium]|nr:hypothetical protein [Candidatus Hydrogenedentota bacterium]